MRSTRLRRNPTTPVIAFQLVSMTTQSGIRVPAAGAIRSSMPKNAGYFSGASR